MMLGKQEFPLRRASLWVLILCVVLPGCASHYHATYVRDDYRKGIPDVETTVILSDITIAQDISGPIGLIDIEESRTFGEQLNRLIKDSLAKKGWAVSEGHITSVGILNDDNKKFKVRQQIEPSTDESVVVEISGPSYVDAGFSLEHETGIALREVYRSLDELKWEADLFRHSLQTTKGEVVNFPHIAPVAKSLETDILVVLLFRAEEVMLAKELAATFSTALLYGFDTLDMRVALFDGRSGDMLYCSRSWGNIGYALQAWEARQHLKLLLSDLPKKMTSPSSVGSFEKNSSP